VNEDGSSNYKIVDNSKIGITSGSLADTFNLALGDPSDIENIWRNPDEEEVIRIMGKLVGI
jgi:hypothetical protein